MQTPLIYSPHYDITFLGLEKLHPFDSRKWGKIKRLLEKDAAIESSKFVEPNEATAEDLLVVHTKRYLQSLNSSLTVAQITEASKYTTVPSCCASGVSAQHRRAAQAPQALQVSGMRVFVKLSPASLLHMVLRQIFSRLMCCMPARVLHVQTGGTVLAGKLAAERGWAINLGGGFHHCCADQGGGFCAYADITLCIQFAFRRLGMKRALIIDLDAHQGNGHERDFAGDKRVYILDMFNHKIYPQDFEARQSISLAVELDPGTSDDEYLSKLDSSLTTASREFPSPDLIVYNAGTDCLAGDPLGRLGVSPAGVIARDEAVFRFARRGHDAPVPVVMVTSGGYQKTNAAVIAQSIKNLVDKGLIEV
eukprot:jgi/Chlat1/5945/Chrsp4S06269